MIFTFSLMDINIVKSEKNSLEFMVDNVTVAELLRVYLNKVDGVDFAAWRREHISKPVLMKVETSGKTPKKAISDAISMISKDSGKIVSAIKK